MTSLFFIYLFHSFLPSIINNLVLIRNLHKFISFSFQAIELAYYFTLIVVVTKRKVAISQCVYLLWNCTLAPPSSKHRRKMPTHIMHTICVNNNKHHKLSSCLCNLFMFFFFEIIFIFQNPSLHPGVYCANLTCRTSSGDSPLQEREYTYSSHELTCQPLS